VATKTWQRVKLFTDKVASERRLHELQRQADQRAVGMHTADTDRHTLPLKDLVKQYVQSLQARNANPDGVRIGEWLLNRLIEEGGWQRFGDITVSAVEALLPQVAETAGYKNTYIKRLKAFVHWDLPDNWPDPLKKLKRVREKGAKKTRERRAATLEEAVAFFRTWSDFPEDRHLCYALAMLNGLRRNEIKRNDTDRLKWGQLHLDAPIPFIDLKQKMGDGQDHVPLHPYVVKLLQGQMQGMPGAAVVAAVPDIKTMKKDLKAAGIELTDEQGRRLDFHALRHSFQTALDRTGCSRAALVRVPSPQSIPAEAVRTGTDTAPIAIGRTHAGADHRLDHGGTDEGPEVAITGDAEDSIDGACQNGGSRYNPSADIDLHALAMSGHDNSRKSL
jgi:integrase